MYYYRIGYCYKDEEGICWLEKDEFLKYSGCKDDYWNGKTLDDITWLIDEIVAWGNNDVYGFVVEEKSVKHIKKEYINQGRVEEYDEEDWNVTDSCYGFYGDIRNSIEWIIDNTNYKMGDLTEVNV